MLSSKTHLLRLKTCTRHHCFRIALHSQIGYRFTRHFIHWLVLDGGPADLEAPILPPLHPKPVQVHVPIMMYHYISPAPTHDLLMLTLTVTPTLFAQQLDYLKQQGYQTITFNQLFDALYYGGPLPKKPIILTFDDGYEDVYQFALPILKAHGYSGMFYIITGKVGWQGYMNWNELHSLYSQWHANWFAYRSSCGYRSQVSLLTTVSARQR